MNTQKKPLFYMGLVFIILVVVNLYRRLWGTMFPGGSFSCFLVYFIYILLLILWCCSLNSRITQRTTRHDLIISAGIMAFWMGVRFIQETFLWNHLLGLRLSGYLIHIPIIWIPLLSFFASCNLGRGDDYRINRSWYWLVLPALMLLLMAFTDPFHHFVYAVIQEEPQPNVYFHPNTGLLLIAVWALTLEAARVFMIFKRNKLLADKSLFYQLVPFAEVILLCLFILPYFLQSFYMEKELIEFSAGIAFLEALSWEIYIYVGLIPVNTQYETVFRRSTLGMQILDRNGHAISKAENSIQITPEMFTQLKKTGMHLEADGQEIWMQPNSMGYTVWQRNVSDLHRIIQRLSQIEAELREESSLLSHELRTKSAKAALQEKNRIYNQLTEEVSDQLDMLKKLLQKRKLCSENDAMLRKICLIGTYVKQRCNLRLIEQAEQQIQLQDLKHSFHDLADSLEDYGVRTEIRWNCGQVASPSFALTVYDMFWHGLEYVDFKAESVLGCFEEPGSFSMELTLREGGAHLPLDALRARCLPSLGMNGELTDRGFRICVWEVCTA